MTAEEQIMEIFKEIIDDESFLAEIRSEFIPFYLNLPYIHIDSEIRRDNVLFAFVFWFLAEIQYYKEGTYRDAWSKRKEIGVFFQAARKFDRLENMMLNGAKDEVGESLVDTVADLANYAILWLTFILRERPEDFSKWVKENVQNNLFKMKFLFDSH